MSLPRTCFFTLLSLSAAGACAPALAQVGSVYYVCPGNVFTNTITAKEAEQRNCKSREAQQPTTIAGPKMRPASPSSPSGPRPTEAKVEQGEQKARDSDARRILEMELQKAEADLEGLRREYNGGEPERRGEERNAQKYLDRVAELKAALTRKEADVAAIRRELSKLPS